MGVATTRAPMGLGPQDLHKKLLHLSQPLSSKCFENSKPEIPLQIFLVEATFFKENSNIRSSKSNFEPAKYTLF